MWRARCTCCPSMRRSTSRASSRATGATATSGRPPMTPGRSRGLRGMRSSPGALRLFSISIVARLPLATLSIALLVHAQRLTASFGAAGVVTAAYAIALGVGAPLLGRLVDRRGQTAVLLASGVASAAVLAVIALLPIGSPVVWIAGLAAVLGLVTPPVGACVRTVLPGLIGDPEAARAAYAVDA